LAETRRPAEIAPEQFTHQDKHAKLDGVDAASSPRRLNPLLRIGRYSIYGEIAKGGMATVHYGRLEGPAGFARTVAVKRLHGQFARDPEFVEMFLDEARLAARIHHPNVVSTIDVLAQGDELFLVLEYVHGTSVSALSRSAHAIGDGIPLPIACAIVCGALHGLHAAHEATNDRGEPLEIVHRDVSPQNILVGKDGIARVLDFGVAKAIGRLHETQDGSVKGKVSYMAPEQLRGGPVDRRADIYAAGAVLWELCTGEKLFAAMSEAELVSKVLAGAQAPPSARRPEVSRAIDAVVMRALSREPSARFGTARQMALALEEAGAIASVVELGDWVTALIGDELERHERTTSALESLVGDDDAVTTQAKPPALEPAPPSRRRSLVIDALVGLVVTAVVLGAVSFFRESDRTSPGPASSSSTVTSSESSGAFDREDPTTSPTSSNPSSTPHASEKGTASRPPVRRSPPAKKPSAAGTCTVASYLDDAGVKHFYNDCPK
jgi:eukaryotic-like serine/threonine-protein kinase